MTSFLFKMGKGRHGFRIVNSKQPKRTYEHRDAPRKMNRYHVFRWLLNEVASMNSGKYLDERCSRGDYHWLERDRYGEDQRYFLVRIRGNYIIVDEIRWEVDGKGVNTYMGTLFGFEKDPVRKVRRILRHPIREWSTFRAAYAKAAPSLNVWMD